MNKETVTLPQPDSKGNIYVPISKFYQHSETFMDSPYHCTFSFRPFFEKIKAQHVQNFSEEQKEAFTFLKNLEKEFLSCTKTDLLQDNTEKLNFLIPLLFPSLFFQSQFGFIGIPFARKFVYMTPELNSFFHSNQFDIKVPTTMPKKKSSMKVLDAGKMILKKFYETELDFVFTDLLSFRDRDTQLERHFKLNIIQDFIDIKPLKPLKKLSNDQIFKMLNEWENTDLWLKTFPPEDFEFEGFIIGYFSEVTSVEILSLLKQAIVEEESGDGSHEFAYLTQLIRSYLQMPDVSFGITLIPDSQTQLPVSWSLAGDMETLKKTPREHFMQGIYGKVFQNKEGVIIGDLRKEQALNSIEKRLEKKGIRSLLMAPLSDESGNLIGSFELASKEAHRFTRLTLLKMEEVIRLCASGTLRSMQVLNNRINLFIQQQYTSIHPSVEWKFSEVAGKFLGEQMFGKENPSLDPIVFNQVYPIYGQADIVGSSHLRNQSIQADLTDNLQRLITVMKASRKEIDFQLLDIYLVRTQATLKRLEAGNYTSSDETQIVELLTLEIHPMLRELQKQFPQLPQQLLSDYFDYLDSSLDIVYRQRKAYEDSVRQLNQAISGFVEQEDEKKQQLLPHFFEKYTTDGVEYNMYLGQSLLQEGSFSPFFLKDFRLWQLILMCDITRLVKQKANDLPIPLTTAQLIFVYNNALSIRFHMDEKQFDVDGAYNVRYEILKKRIDKAVVKGTGERLTQSGKIAIVWLNEKDRQEYLEYLEHLVQQGQISPDIEELELEKLQGAEGLKALRVRVLDS